MGRLRLLLLHLACFAGQLLAQTAAVESDVRRAGELVTAGKPEEAIPIYARLAKASPTDSRLFFNLCIAEFKAGKFQDAAVHAGTALKLDPNLAAADLFLGASYLQLGQEAKAVAPLTRAVDAMPNDRNAGLMLGEALVGSNRYKDALSPLRRASELLPNNPRVWCALGQAYEGLAEETEHDLERSFPDSAYSWALAGDSFLKQHRLENAFGAYRRALVKDASIADVYTGLVEIYRESGHPDWAAEEQAMDRTSERQARDASNNATLYGECKTYRQLAAEAYGRLAQFPPSLESHLRAAKMLDADGLYRKAVEEWRKSLAFAPNNRRIRNGLAWSLFKSRDYDSLLLVLPAMLKEDPEAVDVNFLYGARF